MKTPQTFYYYLKPTLWLCNVFGITYNISPRYSGVLCKTAGFALAFPPFAVHASILLCLAFAESAFGTNFYQFTDIMSISKQIGLVSGAVCIYSKGVYYFTQRNDIKDLILQVNTRSCNFISTNRNFLDQHLGQKRTY